jgi:hypothetical protein
MRLWRMAKFAWREFRGFGHKEYEHVQSLRHNAENWIKASEAEAQSVARQQREAYSKTLELYKLAISTHDPSVVVRSLIQIYHSIFYLNSFLINK